MKKGRKRVGTFGYYIEEVVDYRTKCEANEDLKYRYPPVVPELLLSLLICIRPLCYALFLLFGSVLVRLLFGA